MHSATKNLSNKIDCSLLCLDVEFNKIILDFRIWLPVSQFFGYQEIELEPVYPVFIIFGNIGSRWLSDHYRQFCSEFSLENFEKEPQMSIWTQKNVVLTLFWHSSLRRYFCHIFIDMYNSIFCLIFMFWIESLEENKNWKTVKSLKRAQISGWSCTDQIIFSWDTIFVFHQGFLIFYKYVTYTFHLSYFGKSIECHLSE